MKLTSLIVELLIGLIVFNVQAESPLHEAFVPPIAYACPNFNNLTIQFHEHWRWGGMLSTTTRQQLWLMNKQGNYSTRVSLGEAVPSLPFVVNRIAQHDATLTLSRPLPDYCATDATVQLHLSAQGELNG